jgi:hypothetical protein
MIRALNVSKVEQKEIKLEMQLPPNGFPKSMYFNRFRVEREEGFCLVQFGLVSGSALLDSYSCVLPIEMPKQNQASILDYLNQTGRPVERSPAWKGAAVEKQVEVADIIAMSFRGDMAETCFYVFSLCASGRAARSGTTADPMPAQPLALLGARPNYKSNSLRGCMKNNIFVARLARGAVASTMAACLAPQTHTEGNANPARGYEAAVFADNAIMPDGRATQGSNAAVVVTVTQRPTEWDKGMQREFRALALRDAKGTLTAETARRLEELSFLRNSLLCPPSAEEILLQIKRDRLLEKTEQLLKEYVEFQEATDKKRAAA